MDFLAFPDLKSRGIPFSRQYVHRLIRAGKFPRPVKLGFAGGVNYWPATEIDGWLKDRIAERDAAAGLGSAPGSDESAFHS